MSQETDNKEQLIDIVQQVLDSAKTHGAFASEADIGTGNGLSVTARMGDVETIEHQRDKGLSITVFMGKQKGTSNTTDFSTKAIEASVEAACTIASHAGQDEYAGLLDAKYLVEEVPDLDLHHPWDINAEEAKQRVIECETIARNQDPRITNSDGCTLGSYSGTHIYGNSHGFINGWDWSTHSLDCTVIAEEDGKMQRDGWYSRARDQRDMLDMDTIAREAAKRSTMKLGARKLSTRNVPVIFEAPVASSLFSSFISAISGGSIYRKSSFLLDKLNEQVFADHINVHEQPHILKGLGSSPFDGDGMETRNRDLVTNGVLQSYVLSAYSARKLGLEPTGNAGGVHNLIVDTNDKDLEGLIKEMGTGLLITEMIGFGVNQITGDYSRGASGLWIENGEIQYPVEEITVAGNLKLMFKQIVEIGNDVDKRRNIQTGSVLIEQMTLAGE